MKHDRLSEALSQISDSYIEEAAAKQKKPAFRWIGAVAAILVLSLCIGLFARLAPTPDKSGTGSEPPKPYLKYQVAAPAYPKLSAYPADYDEESYARWYADQTALHDQPDGYADNLQAYFAYIIPELLRGNSGENTVCSPLNLYIALAILAETTSGESRQQILELLKADSIESLRTQAGQVWKAHYNNDTLSTSILSSSLWLHEDVAYNEDTVGTLAEYYYASVFRGQLGTDEMNTALRSWLDDQTGGLLQEQAQNTKLSPNSVLTLATTVLYHAQWQDEFLEENNSTGLFHGASADTVETFMNRELPYGPYYRSDNFGAVYLPLDDGGRMWLLLPDEGVTAEEVLESGEVSRFFSGTKNEKSVIVNLTLPKFEVGTDMDLAEKLKSIGITDIFQAGIADFSPILPNNDGGYVDQVKHAAYISIDEKGVTAAAYTVIDRCGAAMPPEDEIDFVLDRPFLFYIESSDGLPLFTGIVNEP